MKSAAFKTAALACLSIGLIACASAKTMQIPKFFNTDEFVGLIERNESDGSVTLDYELDGADGNPILFKDCSDVIQTPETSVVQNQYHLWRLMQINCKAADMLYQAKSGTQSFWPALVNKALIENLPAAALPDLGGNSLERPAVTLKESAPKMAFSVVDDDSAQVLVDGDLDITYVVMGRADFNQDGIEDLLLRLDWRITTAFGKGFSLTWVSKTSASDNARIVWRDG